MKYSSLFNAQLGAHCDLIDRFQLVAVETAKGWAKTVAGRKERS
jgi:hypothetical protein